MLKRSFQMHPKLLVDVIKRQAGSIQKAIIEGVMNAIEAQASHVTVDVQPRKITIDDDGKGFQSMEEIESFFETFGMPHGDSEKKIWAQFRMGRGQMFAFGRNVWRTGRFQMIVDIDEVAKDVTAECPSYELHETPDDHKGCHIEITLYNPLSPYEVNACRRELEKYIAFVKCPVLINGVQVNRNPEDCPWDKDSNADAYIKLSTSDFKPLSVYNLGVFVCDIRQDEVGVGGIVVSKSKLDVNFARNDVIRSDPMWKRIKGLIENASGLKKVKQKTNLSPAERVAMITRLMDGDPEVNPWKLKLIEDTNCKAYSLTDIRRRFVKFTISRQFDRACDKVMQQGLALCVDHENAELFSPRKPQDMFKAITKALGGRFEGFDIPFAPLAEVVKGIDINHYIVPKEKWATKDLLWIRFCESVVGNALRNIEWKNRDARGNYAEIPSRKLIIGESSTALAWTDGLTYVAINRKRLPAFQKDDSHVNMANVAEVADLLCHEFCHVDEGSDRDHTHDESFYRRFHDNVKTWVSSAIHEASSITAARLDGMIKVAKGKSKVDEPSEETPNQEKVASV
jgi:hypothetical protein